MSEELDQRSAEWFAIRAGKVTASRLGDVLARTKSGYAASRDAYMAELLIERLTGAPVERFQSAAMRQGAELEPQARAAYSFMAGATVSEIGFVAHPRISASGASPDGLIGNDGLVEIKAPQAHTHVETLLGAATPAKYVAQMQWQMACTGRSWCDWVSFCPSFPAGMDLHVRRIERDAAFIANAEAEVIRFLTELDTKVAALIERYGEREAA